MKTVLFLMFFLPYSAYSQSVAWVDRGLKNPVMVTDSVGQGQLSGRQFPVYTADLDSVIQLAEQLSRHLNAGTIHPPATKVIHVGHSFFAITTNLAGLYNTFTVYLSTRSGNVGTSIEVVKPGCSNKKAAQQLHLFLDYLKNNRHIIAVQR